jgi:hypothetical protein
MLENPIVHLIWIAVAMFVPSFICAALLRANGVRGLLAVVGLVAIAGYLFSDFEGWQLGIGTIAALAGLAAGGKLSDNIEYRRVMRKAEAEKNKRKRETGLS